MGTKLEQVTLENYAQVPESRQKRSKRKLRPEMVFDIYELHKAGQSQVSIIKSLGITSTTFSQWVAYNPTVRLAIAKANEFLKLQEEAPSAHSLIRDSLDPELHEVWDELAAYKEGENDGQRAQSLLERSSKKQLQHLWVHAWYKMNFQKTKACRFLGIHPTVVREWGKEDSFKKLIIAIEDSKKDFVEDALMNLVYQGETAAVVFANKTLNRDRGYNEKTEVLHTGGTRSTVQHNHTHLIDLDSLDLPIEVQSAIMDAMEKKRIDQEKGLSGDVLIGELVVT